MEPLNLVGDASASSVEQKLAACEEAALRAELAAKRVAKLAARLRAAAAIGDVSAAAKLGSEVSKELPALSDALNVARQIDVQAIDYDFRRTAYFDAVASHCRDLGLTSARSTEGRLLAYPFSVERGKAPLTLRIGRRTVKSIRPKHVAQFLANEAKRGTEFDRAAFLESLFKCYRLSAAERRAEFVGVRDIYEAMTLRPGGDREYPFFEFLVQLDTINRHGPKKTTSGYTLAFANATTTRGGRGDVVVTESGREVTYTTLTFRKE